MTEFFFDSYALVEIAKRNQRFMPYTSYKVILTKLNLFELHYALIRDGLIELGELALSDYREFLVDFDLFDIKQAAQLKLKFKKRKLSMTDCIGYVLAQKAGLKFLTGDKEFADLPGVEFVK